jgi:DNA-binding transcriptional MocR family regulator
MAPPLPAEIASRWITDGTAERMLGRLRVEAAARLEIGRAVLAGHDVIAEGGALHLWLQLPGGWDPDAFVAEARRRGVAVAPDTAFRVGRPTIPAPSASASAPPPTAPRSRPA